VGVVVAENRQAYDRLIVLVLDATAL